MKITIAVVKDDHTIVQESFTNMDLAKAFLDQFIPPVETQKEEEDNET